MRKLALLMLAFLTFGGLFAASEIADFAAQQEKAILARLAQEKVPLRRQQTEFLCRKSYANGLLRKRDVLIRSGRLTTEKVKALREERRRMVEQLEALDKKIAEASMEAPEIVELQAIIEANNNRIEELHQSIAPNEAKPAQPDAKP